VTIDGIHFVQVEGGSNHSLGLTSEGTVYSWGNNSFGQLGNGSFTNSSVPIQVKGVGGSGFLSGVTSIAAGEFHSLAVSPAGVFAWGNNGYGQLGDGSLTGTTSPVQVKGVGGSGFLSDVTSIAAGKLFSLALTPAGIFAWGNNGYGQLGDGSLTGTTSPVQVKGVGGSGFLSDVTSIAAGKLFSLALTPAGIFAWGYNENGQLGDGSLTDSSFPVHVKGVGGSGFLSGVTSIAAGELHSLAVSPAGVFGWGWNILGELGDGSMTDASTPVQVKGVGGSGFLAGVTGVSAGEFHSIAVSPAGVFAWGYNGEQELGNGSFSDSSTPVQVRGVGGSGFLAGVTSVSAGAYYSLAMSPAGVIAWGYNTARQLGIGSSVSTSAPALSANFQPSSVTFAGNPGTSLTGSGSQWTVVSPAGVAGSAPVVGTANVFGGNTASTTATTSWNVGTYSFNAPAPSSGPSSSASSSASPSPSSSSSSSPSTTTQTSGGALAVTGIGSVGLIGMAALVSVVIGAVGFALRKKIRR
jgi:alpha-tubulin suppressor-like RCC1 family protein